MEHFHTGLQVGNLVREEFNHGLVAPDRAQVVDYLKQIGYLFGNQMDLRSTSLFIINLDEPHYGLDNLSEDGVEDGTLLLVLEEDESEPVLDVKSVSLTVDLGF